MPHVDRRVAVLHVVEDRVVVVIPEADARLPVLPRVVLDEVESPPVRRRLRGSPPESPPLALARQQERALLRQIVDHARRTPASAQVVVEGRVDELHRRTVTRGRDRPRKRQAVVELILDLAVRSSQHDALSRVRQPASPRPVGTLDAECLTDRLRILRHDEEPPRCERRAWREGVVDTVGKEPPREVDLLVAAIDELEELLLRSPIDRFVVNLVEDDVRTRHNRDNDGGHEIQRWREKRARTVHGNTPVLEAIRWPTSSAPSRRPPRPC